jgi:hypothetical protein
MPAKSEKQRELFAIAEHKPSELYKKNRKLLRLTHQQLHEFADTKDLPKKK